MEKLCGSNKKISGWWLTYPSEKYESVGMIISKPPTRIYLYIYPINIDITGPIVYLLCTKNGFVKFKINFRKTQGYGKSMTTAGYSEMCLLLRLCSLYITKREVRWRNSGTTIFNNSTFWGSATGPFRMFWVRKIWTIRPGPVGFHSQMLYVWNTYIQNLVIFGINVGQCWSIFHTHGAYGI